MITPRRVIALVAFIALEVLVAVLIPGRAPGGAAVPGAATRTPALPARTFATSAPDPVPRIAIAYGVGDRSSGYNELAWEGARKVADYFEADLQEVNAEPGDTDATREALLVRLGDARNGLVFVVGAPFAGPLAKVASAYPGTWFAIVDDGSVNARNVVGILFNVEQGAFLVGAAAALTTDTRTIGFIGTVRTPALQRYEAGFIAGARAVDPDIKVQVTYLAEAPGASGAGAPSGARRAALRMYDGRVDVIFAVTGALTDDVIRAASDRGHWVIGADIDWYQAADPAVRGAILTSMVKRVDVAAFSMGMDATTGIGKDGNHVFGVGRDALEYATSGGFVDGIRAQLDAFAARIAAGEILVPTKP